MSVTLSRSTPEPHSEDASLPHPVRRLLRQPELAIAPHARIITHDRGLAGAFLVQPDGSITLGAACLPPAPLAPVLLRHAQELGLLLSRPGLTACLAGLAAARVAAGFAASTGMAQAWLAANPAFGPFARPNPPPAAALREAWQALRPLQPGAPAAPDQAEIALLVNGWDWLRPTEALLQTGGDARLLVDPETGLNHYGCSHRPRPWAITFASSTASSSSERGYEAAESARQRITAAMLAPSPGANPPGAAEANRPDAAEANRPDAAEANRPGAAEAAMRQEADQIRAEIAARAGLAPGGAVILAPSGTDCELLALAICARPDDRVTTILIAPEETGSGVPLAATGCHFAPDTAGGVVVEKGTRIAGFPDAITLVRVPGRDPDGRLRPAAVIEAECAEAARIARADGRLVLLHGLDISKTGYLAPTPEALARIEAEAGGGLVILLDACQLRLTRARISAYLARGWIVLITGSKFLTGPPFAGAVLVPPGLAAHIPDPLPAGLGQYSCQADWPDLPARARLPARANPGLLLRWRAALAEWQALDAVPEAVRHDILRSFCQRLREAIAANPDLSLFETEPPARPDDGWDGIQTILSFSVRPEAPLDPDQARLLYHWLNADLRPALPDGLSAEQERLACLRCHIGQPVPLPAPQGGLMGVLRISAGARLVSGEPSHQDLDDDARRLREIRDALSVLDKISLILRHWDTLRAAALRPSF